MSDSITANTGKAERHGILAGFDGSDVARDAAFWAAAEADTLGCPLVLARSYERPIKVGELTFTPVGLPPDDARAWWCRHSLQLLAERCRLDHPGLEVRTAIRAGHPGQVLNTLATELRADSVVLGTRGHGPIARLVLGSTAADLVHLLDRPVVVVRGTTSPGPVVLGLAGTETDGQAIDFAFDFAARHRSPLLAVHGHHHARGQDALDRVLSSWRVRYPAVEVRTELVGGRPADALVERSVGARLVVVGSHHHNAARRALRGSISHSMLYHACCPVAVVPAGQHRASRRAVHAVATGSPAGAGSAPRP
ncbi:universal stress protein [Actinophytocola oryzae]|uniref:Nucleotide-binding universal stress UspA family protein n=1 Tax=Actinophytocola oryzae TaxID=502181 RepID=A0A4R7V4H2_9PSEU|nr:universal stress protein [Actinophytocola oryzae]TDV44328.1 nucleotide-binding universal stress UspA family protein [Actinophytocola oryzae]